MKFYFYRGDSILMLLERIGCVQPFERFSQVPGHVRVEANSVVFEATWPRVRLVPLDEKPRRDLILCKDFPLTPAQELQAYTWLSNRVGQKYATWAILYDVVARFLPLFLPRRSYCTDSTCSGLAIGAATVVGLPVPILTEDMIPHCWTPQEVKQWALSIKG